jgi:hypothetical protein
MDDFRENFFSVFPHARPAFSTSYTSPGGFILLWVARRADCARRARIRATEDPACLRDLSF